jgi:Arc/MetJ-type ribon-helix-helix transcriptional regulator
MSKTNLQISEELALKLEKKIKETEFKSVQEYINYILGKVVSDIEISDTEQAYTKEEEGAMRERLKEMGYV